MRGILGAKLALSNVHFEGTGYGHFEIAKRTGQARQDRSGERCWNYRGFFAVVIITTLTSTNRVPTMVRSPRASPPRK